MKFVKDFVRLNLLLLSSIILISCGSSDGTSNGSPGLNKLAENEPNDSIATANAVTLETDLLLSTIGSGGLDTDYFSFVIDTVGVQYTINPSVGCTFDQTAWLYDTDGVTPLIDAQDNDNGIGPDNSSDVCETLYYTFTTAGTYYLRVEELDQAAEGGYGVHIAQTILISDEAESNDTFDTASAITIGATTFAASIGNGGLDTDYFSFAIDTVGVPYTINPSVGCTFDQQVWLYDTDGTSLLSNQDTDNAVGSCETLYYTFDTAGTYFLRVENFDQTIEGNYGVQIAETPIDVAESNDTVATATPITVGATAFATRIGNGGVDTDYFSFAIDTVGVQYTINPSVDCTINQQVWLYDTNGTTTLTMIGSRQDFDNGIGPGNSSNFCETIYYTFNAAGTYFLRVEELNQALEGNYSVQIAQTILISDEAESNDTFDTASAITVGATTFAASIDNGGLDTDYFSFVVDTTGVRYTINPSVGCTFDQQAWLYDTDGVTPLVGNSVDGQDNDNGIGPGNPESTCETIYYTFNAVGTYYLRVEELNQSIEGNYGVQVRH